jgi:hypothetical protein
MGDRRAFRIDHGELRAPREDALGQLIVDGYVGRAGIYEYINTAEDEKLGLGKAGTIRRELRPEEEVFREDALATVEGKPLTAHHPKTKITKDNIRAYSVGTATTPGRRDGNRVATSMVISDRKTVERVKKRELVELSPGYDALIVLQPGADKRYATKSNPEGKYDVIQRDIEVNHLALVPHARGGSDLRVRMDGADIAVERRDDIDGAEIPVELVVMTTAVDGHQHTLTPTESSGCTSYATAEGAEDSHRHEWVRTADGKIVIAENAGHSHDVDTATIGVRADAADQQETDMADPIATMSPEEQIRLLKQQLDDATKRSGELQSQLATTATRADAADALVQARNVRIVELEVQLANGAQAMETEAIKQQAERADAAEQALAELKATRETEIRKEAEVRTKATLLLGTEFRADGMSTRQIQATAIKKFAPSEDIGEGKSDAYIASRFDALYDDRMKTARSHQRAGEVLAPLHARETRTDSISSAKPTFSWRDQWKVGLVNGPGGEEG